METFDFTAALPQHTASIHTQRAYYRWVERYLVDTAGWKPMRGESRLKRMSALTVSTLQRQLTDRKLRNWLTRLVQDGHGRQGLDQARAAIVTLSDLMARAGALDPEAATAIKAVSVPPIRKKATPERLLTAAELQQIMVAVRDMATTPTQSQRNDVVATMLCTMALRRDELSAAKWGDLTVQDGAVVLQIGRDTIPVPRPALKAIDTWRNTIPGTPPPHSSLIRRIWKGGKIARNGLSPDGIWLIVRNAAEHAGLGHVTPDDLRRSAVAMMRDAGVPVQDISRLLRHRSLVVTERFLSKLPHSQSDDSGTG